MTGKVKDIVLKHDASRIIQTIVKHGGQRERDQVAGELKGHYKELAQSKYSKVSITGNPSVAAILKLSQVSGYETYQVLSSAPRFDFAGIPVTCSQALATSGSLKCAR